ncbi:hypothetical protein DRQ50_08920, partial [bacterium]
MNYKIQGTGVMAGPAALLALVLVLAATVPATAIENLGFVVGVDRTQLAGDEPKDFSYQQEIGFLVGAVVEFGLARDILLSIQPGYLHTRTGIAYKDKDLGEKRDSLSLDLDWIVVPVLARIKSQNSVFYATGGLDFAVGIGGGLTDGQQEVPMETFIRELDVAALIGAGIELPVSRYLLTIELRYRQGLLNLANDDLADNQDGLPARFRLAGMQFQVGL